MIWDALEAEFGPADARAGVGMLLAYTNDEWEVPLEASLTANGANPRARKRAG